MSGCRALQERCWPAVACNCRGCDVAGTGVARGKNSAWGKEAKRPKSDFAASHVRMREEARSTGLHMTRVLVHVAPEALFVVSYGQPAHDRCGSASSCRCDAADETYSCPFISGHIMSACNDHQARSRGCCCRWALRRLPQARFGGMAGLYSGPLTSLESW